jgi:hypothetical protein
MRPYLKKSFTKIGLVGWLKMKVLSSSPSTANKTKTKNPQKTELGCLHPWLPSATDNEELQMNLCYIAE